MVYSDFKNPLYLITSVKSDNGFYTGRIINWIIPASLNKNNEEFVICLANSGGTYESISNSQIAVLHKLSQENKGLIFKFGHNKSSESNKFVNVEYDLFNEAPVIKGVENTFVFSAVEIHKMEKRSIFKLTKIKTIRENENVNEISIKDYYESSYTIEIEKLKAKYLKDINSESILK